MLAAILLGMEVLRAASYSLPKPWDYNFKMASFRF
jgi:hypothetical protein